MVYPVDGRDATLCIEHRSESREAANSKADLQKTFSAAAA